MGSRGDHVIKASTHSALEAEIGLYEPGRRLADTNAKEFS
jgi:hypothetical protein